MRCCTCSCLTAPTAAGARKRAVEPPLQLPCCFLVRIHCFSARHPLADREPRSRWPRPAFSMAGTRLGRPLGRRTQRLCDGAGEAASKVHARERCWMEVSVIFCQFVWLRYRLNRTNGCTCCCCWCWCCCCWAIRELHSSWSHIVLLSISFYGEMWPWCVHAHVCVRPTCSFWQLLICCYDPSLVHIFIANSKLQSQKKPTEAIVGWLP